MSTATFANVPIKEWARKHAADGGDPFHAVLCDPPYEIGFMNKGWDNSGVAFDVATWKTIYDVLHPGAFMFVFGGSRTFHRMAVAIEDAGFVMHPALFLFGWIQGEGFPKATRIDTQIDKDAGAEREVEWYDRYHDGVTRTEQPSTSHVTVSNPAHSNYRELPSTPLAQTWQGHRYGRQAIKPSVEPILCFQKPYDGRPVDNIVETGAGALNIDAGRIPTDEGLNGGGYGNTTRDRQYFDGLKPGGAGVFQQPTGRWPSNCILSHAPDCTPSHCSAGCSVKVVGEQSGDRPHGARPNMVGKVYVNDGMLFSGNPSAHNSVHNDTGTAARYFLNTDYYLEVAEQIEAADPMLYTPKADRWQREAGLFEGELKEVSSDSLTAGIERTNGKTGDASKSKSLRRNHHATVKPLALTHWLASLLLPPDTYAPRRLLVPFSGVASECIGAMLAGWDHVQGVELQAEYINIAEQRTAFWQQYAGMDYKTARRLAEVKQSELERASRMDAPLDDLPLFRGMG